MTRASSGAEVLERIAKLRGRLREAQAETERRTYHSAELHRALTDSGIYLMLVPRKFGGLECSIGEFYEAVSEVARGCPSTGWCVSLAGSHALTVASIFSERVQAEVFGPEGDFRCPCRGLPFGTATPAGEGRWTVQGRWDYCSGAPYATHFLAGVRLPPAQNGAQRVGSAIVPRSQWVMQDDWGELPGMKGSGSHSIEVRALVPRDFVLAVTVTDIHPGEQTPGFAIHGNPMFAGRAAGFYVGELAAVGIGLLRGALDEYAQVLRTRKTHWVPPVLRGEDPQYQQWYGHVQMLLDTAQGALAHMARLYHQYCAEHVNQVDPFTAGKDMRLMAIAINAAASCVQGMDLIVRTAGASALKEGSLMERLWRDASTLRSHLSQAMRESFERTSGAAHFTYGDGPARWAAS